MNRAGATSGKFGFWLLATLALAGAVCILVNQQRTLAKGRADNERFRRVQADTQRSQAQGEELERLRTENQQLERARRDHQEWRRLRDEVQQLREQAKAVEQLHAENLGLRDDHQRLEQTQVQAEARQQAQQRQLAVAELQIAKEELLQRVNAGKLLGAAFVQYAQNHGDELPNDLNQMRGAGGETESGKIDLSAYELLAAGKLADLDEWAKTAVVREKQTDARGFRIYVLADGHAEMKKEEE